MRSKMTHTGQSLHLLLLAVYLFLFSIQGNSRPDLSTLSPDPSSLTYGTEHLPAAVKQVAVKKAVSDPRDHFKHIQTPVVACCPAGLTPVLAETAQQYSSSGSSFLSSYCTVNPLRGPPAA